MPVPTPPPTNFKPDPRAISPQPNKETPAKPGADILPTTIATLPKGMQPIDTSNGLKPASAPVGGPTPGNPFGGGGPPPSWYSQAPSWYNAAPSWWNSQQTSQSTAPSSAPAPTSKAPPTTPPTVNPSSTTPPAPQTSSSPTQPSPPQRRVPPMRRVPDGGPQLPPPGGVRGGVRINPYGDQPPQNGGGQLPQRGGPNGGRVSMPRVPGTAPPNAPAPPPPFGGTPPGPQPLGHPGSVTAPGLRQGIPGGRRWIGPAPGGPTQIEHVPTRGQVGAQQLAGNPGGYLSARRARPISTLGNAQPPSGGYIPRTGVPAGRLESMNPRGPGGGTTVHDRERGGQGREPSGPSTPLQRAQDFAGVPRRNPVGGHNQPIVRGHIGGQQQRPPVKQNPPPRAKPQMRAGPKRGGAQKDVYMQSPRGSNRVRIRAGGSGKGGVKQ